MGVGALNGFEYVAIMAGETRSASRTITRSVLVAAPIIVLMFILGTGSARQSDIGDCRRARGRAAVRERGGDRGAIRKPRGPAPDRGEGRPDNPRWRRDLSDQRRHVLRTGERRDGAFQS